LLFIGLSRYCNPGCVFGILVRIDLGYFFLILFIIIFQVHPLILSWLEIEFHDFF